MTPDQFIKAYLNGEVYSRFYHFTDASNIPLIQQYGLLSLREIEKLGLKVPFPGGNQWSWDADKKKGLDNYVHLCLDTGHPMLHIAKQDGRISNEVWIKVSPEVLNIPGILFSNGVANKSDVELLSLEDAVKCMDFEILYKRSDWKDNAIKKRRENPKKYELLVPVKVGLEYLS